MAEPSPSCIPALPEWTTSLADTLSTNLLGSDFRRPTGVAPLPPELWLKIFAELDAIDLMTSVSRSCVAFYRLVQLHRHYLPRLPVALRAWVAEDAEGGSSSSSTTYAVEAREAVYRGEPRVKVLYITQSSAGIRAEAEDKEGNVEQITLPLLSKLMSWMNVRWLAVEVQKEGNEGDGRKRNDNTLVMIINWIFRYFDAAEISELRLSSSNVLIEWQLDEHSIKLLRQLPLEEVTGVHAIAATSFKHGLRTHEHLRLAFLEQQKFRITGGRRIMLAAPITNVVVQGSRCSSPLEAIEQVDELLASMSTVTRVSLVIEDADQPVFQQIMSKLNDTKKVKLCVLQCSRREGGKPIQPLIDLIKAHSSTLRIIGRVGVVEAARSFSAQMRLERLSLMTMDLSMDVAAYEIKDELRAVQSSGAQFTHLSYTSFTGFDPTDAAMQDFMKKCGVKSLRLTMMVGPQIASRPEGYPVGKVRGITHLEVGEVVEKPAHYNRLVVHEKTYKEVFPNAGHITFFQSW